MNTKLSEQIENNMKVQGRSKTWLMDQLGISRRTFYIRISEDSWRYEEVLKMKSLGVL